jgi:hypothetical protein
MRIDGSRVPTADRNLSRRLSSHRIDQRPALTPTLDVVQHDGKAYSSVAAFGARMGSGHQPDSPRCRVNIGAAWGPHRNRKRPSPATTTNHGGPETNGLNLSQGNQPRAESIDTVGVTGSIPVSPTQEPPRFWGVQLFPGVSRAALGPHERWLRPLALVPVWPRCGPSGTRGAAVAS